MSLTRIQPSGLDASLNYSVNTLSANTVLDGGIEIISWANGAFAQANSAYNAANAAGSSSTVTAAYNTANNAGSFANGAFTLANTHTAVLALTQSYANGAFTKANTPWSYIQNGSNSVSVDSIGQLILPQTTQGSLTAGFLTSAGNFSFNANGNLWTLDVNGNFNSPYSVGVTTAGFKWPDGTFQNTAASPVYVTQASYTAANNAGSFANGAFTLGNTTNTLATNAGSFANGAFVQANNTLIYATNAGSFANGAFLEANAAYTAATAGVIPIYNQANNAASFANGAFVQANSSYSLAIGAFTKANTPSGITYTSANTAPSTPRIGDQWYKINQDIIFEYISDGTTSNWVDVTTPTLVGAPVTIANTQISGLIANNQIVSDLTLGNVVINYATTVHEIFETANVQASAAGGTMPIYLSTGGIFYYTANATSNMTLNFTFNPSVTLANTLTVGQAVSCSLMVTQGASAYYPTTFQVDGSAVVPKWSGGTTPSSGDTNAIDIYTFSIIKTAATPTYTVLASSTKFA